MAVSCDGESLSVTSYELTQFTDGAVAPSPSGAYLWWTDDAGRGYLLAGLSNAEAAMEQPEVEAEPDYDALLDMAQKVMNAQ